MPLYEYECTACHKRTEKIQKFSDPEITACPFCNELLERVISAPAIAFKGGGWYADGYGNARPKSAGENSGASNSESTEVAAKTTTSEAASAPAATTPAPSNSPSPAPASAPKA